MYLRLFNLWLTMNQFKDLVQVEEKECRIRIRKNTTTKPSKFQAACPTALTLSAAPTACVRLANMLPMELNASLNDDRYKRKVTS